MFVAASWGICCLCCNCVCCSWSWPCLATLLWSVPSREGLCFACSVILLLFCAVCTSAIVDRLFKSVVLSTGAISGALKEGGENATLPLTGVGGSAGPAGAAQTSAQGQTQAGRTGIAPLDVSDDMMAQGGQQGQGQTPQTHTQTQAAHAPGQPHTPAQPHDASSAAASASHAHGHAPAVRPSPSPLSATG